LAFENIEAPGWQGAFHENGQMLNFDLGIAPKTSTTSDATLREKEIANQDGTRRRTVYEPLRTKSYDENDTDPASPHFDTPMVHYSDGLGRLVRVDEITRLNDDGTSAGDLRTWTTRYEYDLNDQLTRITDSQNNVKWMEYDGLKRKTFMNDLDRGIMQYVYDDASNLRETIDAKNQRITYTYDGANRILTEDYHDEGFPFSAEKVYDAARTISPSNRADVVYFYDAPMPDLPQGDNTTATAHNVKGTLAYVWDLSGEEHTSYDARGRVEYTVKRIPDPVFWTNRAVAISPYWLVSYKTGFEYDALDRVWRLTYPDLDQVTYEYNERNQLKRIPGGPNTNVIADLAYLPSGQKTKIDYGNGVRTTYDYDARLRLTKLFTFRTQPSTNDPQLINFTYEFDPNSNIKTIHDRRPDSAVPEGDPRRNTQIFNYDNLNRLTRVQYSFNLPDQPQRNDGVINYRYDRIGNMVSQISDIQHFEKGLSVTHLGDMSYGGAAGKSSRTGRGPAEPPGPHALTAVSQLSTNNPQPRVYPYDPNGNMTTPRCTPTTPTIPPAAASASA
jgi:YD repeat-containing protein